MLPASDGAAQGKSPHELGCPPLPGQWCKPCFQWRQYLAPQYSQMVHLDITSQYLLEKHKCWPFSIDGTVAQAYSSVEGMVSRWMVDANGFDWRFHLIWRWLLLVVPNHDHMVSDHHIPVESCAGWTSSRNQSARSLLKSGQKPLWHGWPWEWTFRVADYAWASSTSQISLWEVVDRDIQHCAYAVHHSWSRRSLIDYMMLKRSPGPKVRGVPSSTLGLPEGSFLIDFVTVPLQEDGTERRFCAMVRRI